MPGYDPEKDKKIKEWRNEETGLLISIQQYGEGEPKLQIGPIVHHRIRMDVGVMDTRHDKFSTEIYNLSIFLNQCAHVCIRPDL